MSEIKRFLPSRRRALRHLAAAASATLVTPTLARAATSAQPVASATVQKSAVQYQDHPMGESACDNCANFIPGSTPGEAGRCTIVVGNISPHGWCVAYVNKS